MQAALSRAHRAEAAGSRHHKLLWGKLIVEARRRSLHYLTANRKVQAIMFGDTLAVLAVITTVRQIFCGNK